MCYVSRRFYCRQNASSATPNQGQDADTCPSGHYCPTGTAEPEKCPPGTFSSATGLSSVDQCLNCTQGQCCVTISLVSVLAFFNYFFQCYAASAAQDWCSVFFSCCSVFCSYATHIVIIFLRYHVLRFVIQPSLEYPTIIIYGFVYPTGVFIPFMFLLPC